eukprot:GFUD01006626.1.p1 GENE.GFUD01006626.1~~GFUD01006626.1.p1  ORF type:complete len:507 (+),score=68.06 GFUD01006626.1:299-1819(+)
MKLKISLALFLFTIHDCFQYNVIRKDPFATLAETLKTNQRAACDGDILQMECPTGTKISIQLVLYGRSAPSAKVCPPTNKQPRIFTGRDGFTCNIREALRTVEELCQSKQSCSIITSATSFGVSMYDPCPGVRKYVEVAYKCRPTTFSSRMLCGGESLGLLCSEPHENIAIFSSSFQSAGSGPIYCPVRSEFIEEALDYSKDEAGRSMKECERSEVTKSLIKICHGEKSCNITADPIQLGAPACHKLHVLLKITYDCMTGINFLPKFVKHLVTTEKSFAPVITEQPDLPNISTEIDITTISTLSRLETTDVKSQKEISLPDKKEKDNSFQIPDMNILHKITSGLHQNFQVIQGNGWKLMLVLTLSTGLGVSCFLILIIIRLCQMYRAKVETPRDTPSHVNLDSDMLDYEINTQLHTPLPEPRIMQISDELPTKFSTLTRNRTKQITKIAPLENYMGEPPKDTVIRYSTIGRNRSNFITSSVRKDLDSDMADPKSFNTSYENNQLYY